MEPSTRWRLRRSWGFCQRHALHYLLVETAFFPASGPHGVAILYEDLMQRAVTAFSGPPWLQRVLAPRRLRQPAPCFMCELGYGPRSAAGFIPERVLGQGRDARGLLTFLRETFPYWQVAVCGRCAGRGRSALCRPHFLRAGNLGEADLEGQAELIRCLFGRVQRYSRSFRWELRGTDTLADRAGLIAAMGWCQGWGPWLSLVLP